MKISIFLNDNSRGVGRMSEGSEGEVKEEIYNYIPPTTTEQSTEIHINTNNKAEQKEAAEKRK